MIIQTLDYNEYMETVRPISKLGNTTNMYFKHSSLLLRMCVGKANMLPSSDINVAVGKLTKHVMEGTV